VAAAQPFAGVVLVVDHDVEQRVVVLAEAGQRGDEPGGQAVGVDGHPQGDALARRGGRAGRGRRRQRGQVVSQRVLEQGHRLGMAAQPRPQFGGGAGLATHHQHRAQAVLDLAHALRHRRRRDVQRPRGALEAAFAHHGGHRGQQGRVQHVHHPHSVQLHPH
jgi:hypothetical protein